jgi:UDP-glucose 4-epimerase
VVERLLVEGHEVSVLDNLSTGKRKRLPAQVKLFEMDILSPDLDQFFSDIRPEVIIHLAAQTDVNRSVENPYDDAKVNILGTVRLLQTGIKYGLRHFIFASSAAVYGDAREVPVQESAPLEPLSPYGLSKMTAESYLRLFSIRHDVVYTIFRLANVYGPGQEASPESGVITIFLENILNGVSPVVYGDGSQTRDFVYVRDVADGFRLAVQHPVQGVFHLSTGVETSINRLLDMLQELSGHSIQPVYRPARPGDIQRSALANDKARQILRWQPKYSIKVGLQEMLEISYNQTR